MSRNRRQDMEKRRSEFIAAFEKDADECQQAIDVTQSLSEQDNRLTTKHIKTLTFLQDIVNENKSLKQRNEELEAELSECGTLHEQAREAPEKLKQMQQEYIEKLDEIEESLIKRHEAELEQVRCEKEKLANRWEEKKMMLESEIQSFKVALEDLRGSLQEAHASSSGSQMIQLKLDALEEENAILKEEQHQYIAENENLRSEVQSLLIVKQQNDKLNNEMKSINQSMKELQLKHDKLSKDSEEFDNNNKSSLMEHAKNKLSKYRQERRIWTEKCHQLESENEKLCEMLREYSGQLENNELLKEKLLLEIDMLKDELLKKKSRPSGEKDFREFVSVKRELMNLKEENAELAGRLRVHKTRTKSLLPALKGPEPKMVVDRRLSAGSSVTTKNF